MGKQREAEDAAYAAGRTNGLTEAKTAATFEGLAAGIDDLKEAMSGLACRQIPFAGCPVTNRLRLVIISVGIGCTLGGGGIVAAIMEACRR